MKQALCAALVVALAACGPESAPPPRAPRLPSLAELCEKHSTDKCPRFHNYVELYDKLFAPLRHTTQRVLEIGVQEGDSLRLWEAYFPSAKIFGLDIIPTPEVNSRRITTMVADQGKREDLQAALKRFGGDYDLIIDDGGHRMALQQVSFATLFPALKSGGLYVIEDMHTSFPHLSRLRGDVEPDGSNSTYTMLDHFIRTGVLRSRYLSEAESAQLKAQIAQCLYFFRATDLHSDFLACWKK